MSGRRGEEGVPDDVIESSVEHPLVDVVGRFEGEHEFLALEQLVEGSEALHVEIGVDAPEVVHHQIAGSIDSRDLRRVAVVGLQKPWVMRGDERPVVRVGPQPILPVGMVLLPRSLVRLPPLGNLVVLPRLMQDPWDHRGRTAPTEYW